MIAFVEGEVRFQRADSVIVDTGGVGYEVFVPDPLAYSRGRRVLLLTYHNIREDGQQLFGFSKEEDYEVFVRLLNVKGIGPKSALNILRKASGQSIIEAIEAGDVNALKSLPGIGAKTASQMILDLKGKLALHEEEKVQESANWQAAKEALTAWGYTPAEIAKACPELAERNDEAAVLIREALKKLAKWRGVTQ